METLEIIYLGIGLLILLGIGISLSNNEDCNKYF